MLIVVFLVDRRGGIYFLEESSVTGLVRIRGGKFIPVHITQHIDMIIPISDPDQIRCVITVPDIIRFNMRCGKKHGIRFGQAGTDGLADALAAVIRRIAEEYGACDLVIIVAV